MTQPIERHETARGTLNELITKAQSLEPHMQDKRQSHRRRRLEIELLNISDLAHATRA